MTRFRTPWPWELPAKPAQSWRLKWYTGLSLVRVDLCPECVEKKTGGAYTITDLCPPCRLAVEARVYL